MRAYLRKDGFEIRVEKIVDFLLSVRANLHQGVRKPVAIELASNQIGANVRTGRRLWDNREIWLKKGRR